MFPGNNHFGLFSIIKSILIKFFWTVTAVLCGFALILFVNNRFDFLPQIQLHDYSDTNNQSSADENNFTEDLPPETVPEASDSTVTAQSFLSSLKEPDKSEQNYEISDLPFDSGEFVLASFPGLNLPPYYSVSKITSTISENGEITEETHPRPAVHPRMGFIILQNSDLSYYLLDGDGTFLCALPEGAELLPARDRDGNPVFSFPDGYMYYSRREKAFFSSSYNPQRDVHGANFDAPSYYDIADESVYRFYNEETKLWGLKNDDGKYIVYDAFAFAYQFSEGFGALQNANGRITIRNENGYSRFTDHSFYPPDTNGIESLGFYTFDHGLMRVRDKKYDWRGNVISDREFVLHLGNTEFFIPQDYKIESYFDGIFLLSKNGKYGYYNYLGEWICQPVYTYALPFTEGLGVIGYADGKKGGVDKNGAFVVRLVFDEITRCSGGVMSLYTKQDGWSVICKGKFNYEEQEQDKITPTAESSLIDQLTVEMPFIPSYMGERIAYDYTMWLYYNRNSVICGFLYAVPFEPSYIGEQIAYDYTMGLYNNRKKSGD